MGYFEAGYLEALHSLASHFTVYSRWFSSLPGPTWANRLFLFEKLGQRDWLVRLRNCCPHKTILGQDMCNVTACIENLLNLIILCCCVRECVWLSGIDV